MAGTTIDRLSVIWKSDMTDKIKRIFFQTTVLLILDTTWTLTKCIEKKLDGNYTRMQRAVLNTSWSQHLTKQELYDLLPLITKTIHMRQTRYPGHCWRSQDEPISDILLWIPSNRRTNVGWPARTYIQQLCADTGWSLEDLEAMDDWDEWRERVREICAKSSTWWWYLFSCKWNKTSCSQIKNRFGIK